MVTEAKLLVQRSEAIRVQIFASSRASTGRQLLWGNQASWLSETRQTQAINKIGTLTSAGHRRKEDRKACDLVMRSRDLKCLRGRSVVPNSRENLIVAEWCSTEIDFENIVAGYSPTGSTQYGRGLKGQRMIGRVDCLGRLTAVSYNNLIMYSLYQNRP